MAAIARVEAQHFEIPLDEVLTDARHGSHTHFELITATITLANGSQGIGYTYTGGRGGRAIKTMIDYDLGPAIIGRDSTDVEEIAEFCEWHVHYVGRGGVAAFAISALDIRPACISWAAIWRSSGSRTTVFAGGAGRKVPTF